MKRLIAVAVSALAVLLAGAPAAVAAPSAPAGSSPSNAVYAALGDSYSSGVGTRLYGPSSGACLRSPLAYAPLSARIQRMDLTFVACSGATTADVQSSQVGSVPRDAALVTITVGGNDVGFAPVLQACSAGTSAQCDAAVSAGRTAVQQVLPGRLDTTFAQIRAHAPHARLVVLGYPLLFGSGPCTAAGLPPAAARAAIDAGTDLLDGVIRQRAEAAHAAFVDVRSRFQNHGTCAATLHRWINPPTTPATDSYHPNIAGQALGYLPALRAVSV
ncbi:SGNH/GDSL hydrolase family protein [Pseudonocardia acidicola]|uniref:SGNH/GDSL hydrolase family protein n=1 Tax=Pseudonocardia acidicola TaxID=2724939 RepID=A0ABX1S8D4_9PSEU|nr:SGNH/GDSL hydrolase family protein [Pseudonocardia acidicola]NMH97806.1 SGNH/GDSL hydrolase family protein [Pseudonocardia acidicola]